VSQSKGQLTVIFIAAFALVIGLVFMVVYFGGVVGLVSIQRSVEVFVEIDDRGTGLVALLGTRANSQSFPEALVLKDSAVETLFTDVAGERSRVEVNSHDPYTFGSPLPEESESIERAELDIPLPGAQENQVRGTLGVWQW